MTMADNGKPTDASYRPERPRVAPAVAVRDSRRYPLFHVS